MQLDWATRTNLGLSILHKDTLTCDSRTAQLVDDCSIFWVSIYIGEVKFASGTTHKTYTVPFKHFHFQSGGSTSSRPVVRTRFLSHNCLSPFHPLPLYLCFYPLTLYFLYRISLTLPLLSLPSLVPSLSDSDKLPIGLGNPSCRIPHLNTHSPTPSYSSPATLYSSSFFHPSVLPCSMLPSQA